MLSENNKLINQNVEQPELSKEITFADARIESDKNFTKNINKIDNQVDNSGSTFGKFKDANSLFKAYNELESEFTKKSQILSQLEKSLGVKKNTTDSDNSQKVETVSTVENELNKQIIEFDQIESDNKSNIKNCEKSDVNRDLFDKNTNKAVNSSNTETLNNSNSKIDNASVPIYELDNWHELLGKFLSEYENSKYFSEQICNEILSDKVLALSPNSLEIAYGRVLGKNYKTNEQLIKDEKFLENYILKNNEIKNKIIKNYLDEIKNKTTPLVVTTSKGSKLGVNQTPKATNLTEAKLLMSRMFDI